MACTPFKLCLSRPSHPPTGRSPTADGHGHAPGHVSGGEMEAEIVKALTVGCYATAVDHCLAVHRYADALLIANTAGRDLYQRTMHTYMQKCPHPYQVRGGADGWVGASSTAHRGCALQGRRAGGRCRLKPKMAHVITCLSSMEPARCR